MVLIKRNNIECQVNKKDIYLFKSVLEYDGSYYVQGPYSKKKSNYKAYFMDQKAGTFLTGLLPRVTNHLIKKNIEFEIDDSDYEVLNQEVKPNLPGLDYNKLQTKVQLEAVNKAIKQQRGVIKFPTGTGKTIVALLFMSAFPSTRILFLCHTKDLLYQTKDELVKFGFKNLILYGDNLNPNFDFKDEPVIVLAIDKTFIKINSLSYDTFFDIVICDESHHVANENCAFAKILNNCFSPIKIGLTATPHISGKKQLVMEGYIGPVIAEVSIEQAIEDKMLVPIKLNLIPIPVNNQFADIKSFNELYKKAIIQNKIRNSLLLEEAMKHGTCLIMVKQIEHGQIIADMLESIYPNKKYYFIQGNVSGEERSKIKKLFNEKQIDIVIATSVWKEGVNIPSLNHVINACGYKSEIPALQMLGRGSRTSEGKTELILTDFIDCYKSLSWHFALRMAAYKNAGWI